MNQPTENTDLQSMPVSERMKTADMLGQEVGKVLNKAIAKCNKFLKKYGYSVSVTLNFHELDDKDTK